jgi:hypothetical protein
MAQLDLAFISQDDLDEQEERDEVLEQFMMRENFERMQEIAGPCPDQMEDFG